MPKSSDHSRGELGVLPKLLGVSAALAAIALAIMVGAMAKPAGALVVAGVTESSTAARIGSVAAPVKGDRQRSAIQPGDPGAGIVRPGQAKPGELDLAMVAAVGLPVIAIGSVIAGRPRLARRRTIRRFRAELRDGDLVSFCAIPPPTHLNG